MWPKMGACRGRIKPHKKTITKRVAADVHASIVRKKKTKLHSEVMLQKKGVCLGRCSKKRLVRYNTLIPIMVDPPYPASA